MLNDPKGGDDLIAKWAKWRKPRPKTIYETRRIMRKLTDFVQFDDLARLTKADVERWLEHLDEAGAAPKTLEGHLLTLKTLVNFAVEKDMISDNPIAKIRYRAKAEPAKEDPCIYECRGPHRACRDPNSSAITMRWLHGLRASPGRGSTRSPRLMFVISSGSGAIGC